MPHQKAVDNMRDKIIAALNGCEVANRYPVFPSYTDNVLVLSNATIKQKGEWLTLANVYSIFSSEVGSTLIEKFPDDNNVGGTLPELFSDKELSMLAEKILNIILSIPRAYTFYFPLPKVNNIFNDYLKLADGICLRCYDVNDDIPGGRNVFGLSRIATPVASRLEFNKVYLCIDGKGFTTGNIDDSAFNQALSKFKILSHLLLHRRILMESESIPTMYGLMGSGHIVPNLNVTAFDLETVNEVHSSSLLPISISKHTDRLAFNEDNRMLNEAIANGVDAVRDFLNVTFRVPISLLEDDGEFSAPTKSAIEWAYDAAINDNQTLAFIQVCIGMEAILGDDTESESITATLADRCAYLLSNDIQGRKKIRDNFRKVYRLRSKLAHGRVTRMRDDEWGYFKWGKDALNFLIEKEIKHLNLGKR